MEIKGREIGTGHPVYIIAEVGINHNGDINQAIELIRRAAAAGVDAVKFQRRTLPEAIPVHMRDTRKRTPWGDMSYLEYKQRLEFDREAYFQLASRAHHLGLDIGISVWDSGAAHWAANTDGVDGSIFDFLKLPSALMSNEKVVHNTATMGLPFFWSTGMHTLTEVITTRRWLSEYTFENWGVLHCNSSYPAAPEELNLRVLSEWNRWRIFEGHPVGYSGHEVGLATTIAAVALGASIVERHITASVEPEGFRRLVRDIHAVESALGDGAKIIYPSEEVKRYSLTH